MLTKTVINAAGRSVPLEINGQPVVPFKGVGKHKPGSRKYSPPFPTCSDYPDDGNKVVGSLEEALIKCGLKRWNDHFDTSSSKRWRPCKQ
jgi:citrate lyase subunit alpha/citrate CoA-transferase